MHWPVCELQESAVHGLPSSQLVGGPFKQRPAWQVSAPLQGLPSEQEVPLGRLVWTQPEVALQVSVVQTLLSLQLSGGPG